MTQDEITDRLNELIQVCRDGERGFETAANDVQNSELETMFRGYAKQRAGFARELQAEVERLGGKPSDSAHAGSVVHRAWMNVKSSLSGGDPATLIAACESGEDSALAAYDQAAHAVLTGSPSSLIEKQFQQIKEAHTRISRLKHEMEDGTRFPKNK